MPTSSHLLTATNALIAYCAGLTEEQFFRQPGEKWSVAQHVKHLTTATNMARLPFRLPALLVRWIGGRPNRPSRSYEELVEKYRSKLQQGGRASGRYVPRPIPASVGKQRLLDRFQLAMTKFATASEKGKQGAHPDHYLAPHPLLGKITLRELCYFTSYHTLHHLETIREMQQPPSTA